MLTRPQRPSTTPPGPGRSPPQATGVPPSRPAPIVATSTQAALDPTDRPTTSWISSSSVTSSTSSTTKSTEDQAPSDQTRAPQNDQPALVSSIVRSLASNTNLDLLSTSASVDAFGGAVGQTTDKENITNAASSTQSLLVESPNGSQEDQIVNVNGDSRTEIETNDGQTPAITVPGDRLAPADGSAAAEQISGSPSMGKIPIIGGAVAAVIAAAIAIGLLFFCLKRHRRRRALERTHEDSSVMRVFDPAPIDDHWAKFDSASPVTEKRELSSQEVLERFKTKNSTDIADALQAIMAANASTAASERSDHVLYSHFQDVMPPPSMRSKRNSRTTMHTLKSDGGHTPDIGFGTIHPSDSQTQIPYPFERPPSSIYSIATALPSHRSDGSFRASPQALPPLTMPEEYRTTQVPASALDFGTRGHSSNASARSAPTISRSSTMTDVSFRARGSEENVGRAL